MTILTRLSTFFLSRGITFCLQDRGIIAVENARSGGEVRCMGGTVWITQSGMAADVLLAAGESWRIDGRGKVVIEALGEAQVVVETRG